MIKEVAGRDRQRTDVESIHAFVFDRLAPANRYGARRALMRHLRSRQR
jgi:hypothetical protein